jgi:hypothetical protein
VQADGEPEGDHRQDFVRRRSRWHAHGCGKQPGFYARLSVSVGGPQGALCIARYECYSASNHVTAEVPCFACADCVR